LAGGDCGLNKSKPFDFSFGQRQVHVTNPFLLVYDGS
jgi:hypothetical protein